MNRPSFLSSPRSRRATLAFLLPLACGAPSLLRAAETAPATGLHELTYSGDPQPLAALDREIQAAGRDRTKLAAVEKRLLADLARRDATFAARQAIAQRLALVLDSAPDPKSAAHKALAAMLVDPRDSDVARLALQPVPGAAIDTLFVNALPKATGRARLGVIDSIAARRIEAAVTALSPLLTDRSAPTAQAAARALGAIGTPAALAALRGAPIQLTAAARLAAATRLPAAAALAELRELQDNTAAPRAVRDAAFRTSLELDLPGAATHLVNALAAPDTERHAVALEAIAASRAPDLVAALTEKLSAFAPATQSAVIAALSRRHDRDRIDPSPILAASRHADATVRSAAISALGFLPGNREVVTALAQIAANASASDDARLARQSLARLNGPDVSAAILAAAAQAGALRPVYLEQLALRHQTEGLPLLLQARSDPDSAVRLAALTALGDIAPDSAQRALLDWTLAATDEAEQSRALRSLVNVILRQPATETRGQLLFEALANAKSDVAARLLPALNRLGGVRAASTAAQLATRDDPKLADSAATALTRWPDATALPALATVAEKATTPGARDTARQGALRYFERNRDAWTPASTDVVARLLKSTTDAGDRAKLVALLHRADDASALRLAESLKSDAALGGAAGIAAEVVRANQAGKPRLRASAAANSLNNVLDRKTNTRWNVPTEGAEWVEIDFRRSRPLQTITLDQTTRAAEFPERYEVHVTDDPKSPGPVVASGQGQQGKTIIKLPANTRGRYAIIKNTAERKDSQWSIVELYVD